MSDVPTHSCSSCGATVYGTQFCEHCGAQQPTRNAVPASTEAPGVEASVAMPPVAEAPAVEQLLPARPVNGKARASLSLAIGAIAVNVLTRATPAPISTVISFLALAMLVVAIVLGHVARREIRRTNEAGAGWALAGILIGYIVFGIDVILVIVVVALTASYFASL